MSTRSEAVAAGRRAEASPIAQLLAWAALPLAFVGMGISAYLSFVHLNGIPLYCEGSGGCHTVQASEYATLLGVPVALLGFILYASIFAASAIGLRGAGAWTAGWAAERAPFLVFGLALSGVLYSGYLTWLELYRIHAICAWCVASACLLAGIFVIATAQLAVSGRWKDVDME